MDRNRSGLKLSDSGVSGQYYAVANVTGSSTAAAAVDSTPQCWALWRLRPWCRERWEDEQLRRLLDRALLSFGTCSRCRCIEPIVTPV